MKILFISHTLKKDINLYKGSHLIASHNFKEMGNKVKHVCREEWFSFFKIYNKFRPDIIISVGVTAGFIVWLKKLKLINCKTIFHWGDNYVEIMGEKWGKKIVRFLENSAVRYSDLVITISKYRLEKGIKEFKKIEGENIFYLPQGYNPSFLNNPKIKLPGHNKIKIVYAGELFKEKRFGNFLEKFKKLRNVDLILLGAIRFKELPKDEKNIFYLGWISQEKVYSYLKSADFLLVTEDNDSSLKLFEYQVLGKPVLVPKGRISKYLNFKNNLYYTDFSDINKLIKNKYQLKKQKVNSWEEIGKKYLEIIK